MTLSRLNLVAHRSSVVTPDVAEALRQIEQEAAQQGHIRISFKGTPRSQASWVGTGSDPHLSLRPTGREVRLRAHLPDSQREGRALREQEIATLWGLAIPAGFTPWLRYPVLGDGDDIFHFLGPWQPLYDHLCGEGRGELAWVSVCCAAQSDVGTWEGDRRVERFVQAQLHRLGLHCGPVDGFIGERTAMALRSLGMTGLSLEEMAVALGKLKPPIPDKAARRMGYVLIPGDDVSVQAYGKVASVRTLQGVSLAVDGPGKVIITIGQET